VIDCRREISFTCLSCELKGFAQQALVREGFVDVARLAILSVFVRRLSFLLEKAELVEPMADHNDRWC